MMKGQNITSSRIGRLQGLGHDNWKRATNTTRGTNKNNRNEPWLTTSKRIQSCDALGVGGHSVGSCAGRSAQKEGFNLGCATTILSKWFDLN